VVISSFHDKTHIGGRENATEKTARSYEVGLDFGTSLAYECALFSHMNHLFCTA
jgi:hypothetical protein